MITTMSMKELEKNEDTVDIYDYIDIKDDDNRVGIFVSDKYAEEVKEFIHEKMTK